MISVLGDGQYWQVTNADWQWYLLDGCGIAGLVPQVVEHLGHTWVTVLIFAMRVDDPHLAEMDRGRQGRRFLVAGDELDVLDTAALLKSNVNC